MGWGKILLTGFVLLAAGCDGEAPFQCVRFVQEGGPALRLNETLVFRFNREVDRSSLLGDTVFIRDRSGKEAQGRWQVSGREIRFNPRLPREPDCSDAGLLPGRVYEVQMTGFPSFMALLSTGGEHLARHQAFSVETVASDLEPLTMFVDPWPGSGPTLSEVGGGPMEGLSLTGIRVEPDTLLTLRFSEPLFPPSVSGTGAKIQKMNVEGVIDPELDTLDLICRLDGESKDGCTVAVQPRGGFQDGVSYKLWCDFLDFVDFGGSRVENTFSYIWINCAGNSGQ